MTRSYDMHPSLVTSVVTVALAVLTAFAEPIRVFVSSNPTLASLLGAVATILAAAQKSFLTPKE